MTNAAERKPLTVVDAIGLIVGIIIGAGIFETPAKVSAAVASPMHVANLWLVGWLIALCGAFCYAELAATYPTDAGEAEYLRQAFGPFAGWYFTWIQLVCFRTAAAIVTIAYIFAKYAQEIWHLPIGVYVTASIVVFTIVNAFGLRPGKWTQNLLTLAKISGMTALIGVGFALTPTEAPEITLAEADRRPLALAAVLIMYAYSGWHEAAYIVGDLRDPGRALPRAMFIGVTFVAVIYGVVNLAAVLGLGFQEMQLIGSARSLDTKFGAILFGRAGLPAWWFASLVVIVTLGSINGTTLSGSRLFAAVGSTQPGYGWLSRGRTRRDAPLVALLVQAMISLAFVAAIEWRGSGADGFDLIVAVTSPVLWLVFLAAGVALLVLRRKQPAITRPFRVPLYPIVPLIYIAGCVFMLLESTKYAMTQRGPELWLMAILLLLGFPYWWYAHRRTSSSSH
jgi:amino acid transporter